MIFRLSQKLNKKIKAGPLDTVPPAENPFADWSAHLFTAARTQYILLSNTKSLYSCVLYGRGVSDEDDLIIRAQATIREFMEDDGQQFVYEKFIIPETGTIQFAKALNRTVTGSMNELIKSAEYRLLSEEISPHELGFYLNGLLLSAIGTKEDFGYSKPRDAFTRLVEEMESGE